VPQPAPAEKRDNQRDSENSPPRRLSPRVDKPLAARFASRRQHGFSSQ
jgi:hypothetical protein